VCCLPWKKWVHSFQTEPCGRAFFVPWLRPLFFR
jgi:hypothetical protein